MNDLKYALRMLRKQPGFTAVVVLTLALGIGANTAIFTVINTLLLRALPVTNPDELVQVSVAGPRHRDYSFSFPQYERLRDGGRSLSGLFAAGGVTVSRMTASGMSGREAEFVGAQPVTGNFFTLLGVSPFLGRLLGPTDDRPGRAEAVVVISHGFWQRRFGADRAVIGKTIALSDVPVTIVGVAPAGFFGFQPGDNPDLWWPLQLSPLVDGDPSGQRLGEGSQWLRLIGRLPRGSGLGPARAELAVAYAQHDAEHAAGRNARLTPEEQRRALDERLDLLHAAAGWTMLRDRFRGPLAILAGVVGLVLLIACANVAGLLLARSAARVREFSIRAALGAHRFRLIRQLLTESVLLAGMGGLLGLFFAHWGARLLVSQMGLRGDPVSFDLAQDARVLGFTLALSLVTGIVFGLAPALRSSRADLASSMRGPGGGIPGNRSTLQHALLVGQVALSLVLMVGAGLFVRTLQQLRGIDMGFQRENVVLLDLGIRPRMDPAGRALLYREVLARLEETPGVRTVSLSAITPLSGNAWGQRLDVEGYASDQPELTRCYGMSVAPQYFETMGMPLLAGRDFGPRDDTLDPSPATNAPSVAVINETMARRFFGAANPLGRRFSFVNRPDRKFEVVGVVKDAKYRSLRDPAPPTFYLDCFQEVRNWNMVVTARVSGRPEAAMENLRRALRETGPGLQVREMRTLEAAVNASLYQERVIAGLGSVFGVAALALVCLGIYGTLSFHVAQRTREIGVRLALGARRREVLALVIGRGLKLVLAGALVGLAGSLAAGRLLASLLYGVGPSDPVTIGAVSLLVLGVALTASWLPARRAACVDPIEALRCE